MMLLAVDHVTDEAESPMKRRSTAPTISITATATCSKPNLVPARMMPKCNMVEADVAGEVVVVSPDRSFVPPANEHARVRRSTCTRALARRTR
jgi:hypothetical protein